MVTLLYQSRFFVLDDCVLKYYVNEQEPNSGIAPKGKIDLSLVVEAGFTDDETAPPGALALRLKSGRMHTLHPTPKLKFRWASLYLIDSHQMP